MRVTYQNFPIFNSNGSTAGVLNGTYEATPNEGQQPGWFALREVKANNSVDPSVVANIHVVGATTT